MKIINKFLCFLSVFVLCVPLLCFNVSADSPSGYLVSDLKNYVQEKYTFSDSPKYSFESKINSVPFSDSYIQFSAYDPIPVLFYFLNEKKFNDSDSFYFFAYNNGDLSSSNISSTIYFSKSPITFDTSNSSHISFVSDSTLYCCKWFLDSNSSAFSSESDPTSHYFDSSDNSYLYLKNPRNKYSTMINGSGIPNYPDFLPNADRSNITDFSDYLKTLPDLIDVKLTPDFGLDMDRIDPFTNQSDYFKFEITNNSDSAIQWCAGIYDPELVTADTMNISSLSSWCYVCRTTYYDFLVKEDKGIFRTTYTYSGALKTGCFDCHYLEPGETFSDLIFWENINIKPNVIYHFFVNAVKTDLNYASSNIDPPVTEESSDIHSVTVIEDTYYNTILEGASSFKKLDCNIYNIEFSCLSMPAFTTTVRGGNSVLNTSGNDRYLLNKNYETVSDINGLDTKINKNYTDPAILANTFNRSDVSVDIDNVGLDDVKSYITYSQDFFSLIKSVLTAFPAFVWVLICFGLTGLIVIAIVKALL